MSHERPDTANKGKIKKQKSLLFSGIIILTAANLIIKFTGLLFKIPMNYIVGDTGMGYYGSAYSVYTFLYMLSTAGLPVAVSIMTAESRSRGNFRTVKKVFRTALFLFVIIGWAGSGIMLFYAPVLARFIGSEPSAACIVTIAPTLLFICVSSAYRGYFQGFQQMTPVAVSQLLEALSKLILGIRGALYSIRMGYGIPVTAAFAVSGLTAGSLLGMLYLMAAKLFFHPDSSGEDLTVSETSVSTGAILRRFAAVSVPITLSAAVMSLSGMIDTVLIQRMLRLAGMAQEEATAVYGNYTSLAVPLFNLPPVLIYPITYSIIPLLTSARAVLDRKKIEKIVESSLRASVLIGVPCAFGLAALSSPILRMFYRASSAQAAAPLLTLLAPSSLFVCLLAVTNAVLQAYGRAGKPVLSMLAGAAVKIVSGCIFVRMMGISGAPISTFLCYFTATVINFTFVIRYTAFRPDFVRIFMKPLAAGIGCGAAAHTGYRILAVFLPDRISTLCAVGLGAAVYMTVIFLTDAVNRDDLEFIPGKNRIRSLIKIFRIRKKLNHEYEYKGKTDQRKKT